MILYQIQCKSDSVITNQWYSTFADSTHYEPCFGRPQRTVASNDPAIVNENISQATSSSASTDGLGNAITLYVFAADYNLLTTDLGTAPQLAAVRAQRDALLAACDWTQMSDSPLSSDVKAAWGTYRTALRNLPDSQGFDPTNPTWPVKPS